MKQIVSSWTSLTVQRRVLVVGASIAMFALILMIARMAARPDMELLYSGLETGAAGEVMAFLPVEPVIVSLAGAEDNRHLRFRAELEVPSTYASEVEHLMPRVVDVMNAYLRAVEPKSLSSPGALIALRAQILRRVNLVIGAERVNDVLVMEFVLS